MKSVRLDDKLLEELNNYYRSYEKVAHINSQECLFCYTNLDNAQTPFYICLKSYLGFCAKHLIHYLNKINKYFIMIMRTKFSENSTNNIVSDNYTDVRSIVFANIDSGVCALDYDVGFLSHDLVLLLNSDIISKKSSENINFNDPDLKTCAHVLNIKQEEKFVGNSGWKCHACDLDTNLWLNLSDGKICCGRPNNNIPGNNHSFEHYNNTKNCIVVKLTSLDACAAEIYCYEDDRMVIDENLDFHLNTFGIDRKGLVRTETTLKEKEMALNINFQFNSGVNNGKNVLLFGPAYTGIFNLGNTCYMASVLQILFNINEIKNLFENDDFLKTFVRVDAEKLASDVFFQLSKFCFHIFSGEYSQPNFDANGDPVRGDGGIKPILLKRVLTHEHVDFGGFHQQDAAEFFLFFLDKLSKTPFPSFLLQNSTSSHVINNSTNNILHNSKLIPTNNNNTLSIDYLFDFKVREYYQSLKDPTDIVERISKEKILRINIPIDKKDQNDYIDFESCKDLFCLPSSIESMKFKTHTGPGVVFYRLATLPTYLVVQICRFSVNPENYTMIKLNVKVKPPKILDLGKLVAVPDFSKTKIVAGGLNENQILMMKELKNMGFDEALIRKALFETKSQSVNQALDWIISHPNAVVSDNPISEESIMILTSMGFTEDLAKKALVVNNGNPEQSIEYLLTKLDSLEKDYQKIVGVVENIPLVDPNKAVYEMCGFISHMGNSPTIGHYLCHLYREEQWVIYNDNYVAECLEPPFEDGYLYFYRIKN